MTALDYYRGYTEDLARQIYDEKGLPFPTNADEAFVYLADALPYDLSPYGEQSALIRDPSEQRRIFFAAGDLDGAVTANAPEVSYDKFYLSAGMQGQILEGVDNAKRPDNDQLMAGMDTGSGGRAFLRAETWTISMRVTAAA